jgi:transcriptional regulator with XRE-family HTH domain
MVRPLTQAGLGRLLGINQSTISRWESGEMSPSEQRLARIARIVRDNKALRERVTPRFIALLDGEIAAIEPGLLIEQCRILLEGAEGLFEELLASTTVAEFDTLKSLLDLARQRLAEIRNALDPLTKDPS